MSDRIGLANLGNTCFLNVVLQALRITPCIVNMFVINDKIAMREDSKRREMVSAFQTLMKDMWSIRIPPGSHPTLLPRGFLHSMLHVLRETDDDWFRMGQQADATEALQYVLNSLHDALYRRVRMEISGKACTAEEESHIKCMKSWGEFFDREYSPIIENFNGQHQIKITCHTCNSVSERYEPWLSVKVPIPGAEKPGASVPDLEDCLNSAFEPEILDDYYCEHCKNHRNAKIQTKISRLPPVVILSFKRFTNAGNKVRGRIPWNLDLVDFQKWHAFRRDPFTNSPIYTAYETYAVIEHFGSTHGGHYKMYAREDDNAWVEYDDNSVKQVLPEHVVSPDSYIACMMPKHFTKELRTAMREKITNLRESTTTSNT